MLRIWWISPTGNWVFPGRLLLLSIFSKLIRLSMHINFIVSLTHVTDLFDIPDCNLVLWGKTFTKPNVFLLSMERSSATHQWFSPLAPGINLCWISGQTSNGKWRRSCTGCLDEGVRTWDRVAHTMEEPVKDVHGIMAAVVKGADVFQMGYHLLLLMRRCEPFHCRTWSPGDFCQTLL